MIETNLITYFLQIAPAVAICLAGLAVLWKAYLKQIEYQREQDKSNLHTLQELSIVLASFQLQSTNENKELKQTMNDKTKEIKSHVDERVRELKEHGRR